MSKVHILIQRWFSDGEGWAYDAEFPSTLRMEAVSKISQVATGFHDNVIEQVISIGSSKYELYIRVEPDLNCPDILARKRHPHIDIGILSENPITPTDKARYQSIAPQVIKRGEFNLSDFGIINHNNNETESSSSSSILFPLLLILLLLAYPAYLFFCSYKNSQSSDTIHNENRPNITYTDDSQADQPTIALADEKTPTENRTQVQPAVDISENNPISENSSLNFESNNDGTIIENEPALDVPHIELKFIDQWAEKEIAILKTWEFRLLKNKLSSELLPAFIEALNQSRMLRIQLNTRDKYCLENCFLEDRFPRNEISYPNNRISETEYHSFIENICSELHVSSFEEIEQRLSFKEYFNEFSFESDRPLSDVDKEIRDFTLQWCPEEKSESLKNIAKGVKNLWKSRFTDYNMVEEDIEIRPWFVIWYFSYKHLDSAFTSNELVNNSLTEREFAKQIKNKIPQINPRFAKLQFTSENFADVLNELFDCKEVFDRTYGQPKIIPQK